MAGLLVYFAAHMSKPGLWLPVGMVFGGALGNLSDRARIHGVTDFIDPVLWPAFNVADMCIVIGVLGVLYLAEQRR
jgi:signal peptidase II